ncbi:MAG TPA: hypothetical protein VIE43_19270 [Thermoanaerobaculia bacterium]|jgi:hypothetical protein|nr:hypothetical protein [Thermoanaerobaculia bacterium]
MNRLRFALLTLALVLTFAARAPKANAACLIPCSKPDGVLVQGPPSGCCTAVVGHEVHSFQRYAVWVCTAGCAHPMTPAGNTCSTTACQPA